MNPEEVFEREWEAQEREDEMLRVRDPDEKYWKAGIFCTEESEPVHLTSNLEIFVCTSVCTLVCVFVCVSLRWVWVSLSPSC